MKAVRKAVRKIIRQVASKTVIKFRKAVRKV